MNTVEQIGLSLFNAFLNVCIGIAIFVGGNKMVERLDKIKTNTDGTLKALRGENAGLQDDKNALQDDKAALVEKVHIASTKPATRKRKR